MNIQKKLQQEFDLAAWQVENVLRLIDEGNTIPFIARYRKEATGEMDDQLLRLFADKLSYLRNLETRKSEVLRAIEEQGKLTPELAEAIEKAEKLSEIEDLYRPYKQKRRTRATVARERGLEPLAKQIMAQNPGDVDIKALCEPYLSEEVPETQDALDGAMDIIAEEVSDNAEFRKHIREYTLQSGRIESRPTAKKPEPLKGRSADTYAMYFEYIASLQKVANHQILALDRGESEGFIAVSIDLDSEPICGYLAKKLITNNNAPTAQYVEAAARDAYSRLIRASIEREIRSALTERAQEGAMTVFSKNLKSLLLGAPIKGHVVMGLDPAYRTGCKLAVVNDTGKVLDTAVIYPHKPVSKKEEAMETINNLIEKHSVTLISIGNGTASRESEIFVADIIKEAKNKVKYTIVSEAGASVYSASKLAAEEFPNFDVSQRSAVSIARRLQDPLAELVKIDPKSIGVGQYQHDMNQKRLGETLGGVVEDCVNNVGVDLNTASPALLSYISGINSTVAKNIVVVREENGRFTSRRQLKKVPKLGEKAYQQCAGFLRVRDGENVLDNTAVHPESYGAAGKLLDLTGYSSGEVGRLDGLADKVRQLGEEKVAETCGVGIPTLRDIVNELLKPGRDPRDSLPQAKLREGVLELSDLREGMILDGTVRNVADFGAFVDIGVHQDGLVHVSEMADRFVKDPMSIVSVGDIVKVKIMGIDENRGRISLSMKV